VRDSVIVIWVIWIGLSLAIVDPYQSAASSEIVQL